MPNLKFLRTRYDDLIRIMLKTWTNLTISIMAYFTTSAIYTTSTYYTTSTTYYTTSTYCTTSTTYYATSTNVLLHNVNNCKLNNNVDNLHNIGNVNNDFLFFLDCSNMTEIWVWRIITISCTVMLISTIIIIWRLKMEMKGLLLFTVNRRRRRRQRNIFCSKV